MIDQSRIHRAFSRAAAGFSEADFLHAEIRQRLLDRLQILAVEPRHIVDLGAGTCASHTSLQAAYPQATVLSVDLNEAMLRQRQRSALPVCAEAAHLPLVDGGADLVFSNLMLHHCADPAAALAEARRILSASGVVLLTTFGPATLLELGRAWATADQHTHIAPFFDKRDVGGLLGQAGFSEPVLDSQTLTVTYADLDTMLAELRAAGSANSTQHRNRGLTGRGAWQRLQLAYDQLRDPTGRLPVTIEIVFAIAWAGRSPAAGNSPNGVVEIPLTELSRRR